MRWLRRRGRRDREQILRWLLAEQTHRAQHARNRAGEARTLAAAYKTERDSARTHLAAVERSDAQWQKIAQTAIARGSRIVDAIVLDDGSRWSAASVEIALADCARHTQITARAEAAFQTFRQLDDDAAANGWTDTPIAVLAHQITHTLSQIISAQEGQPL